MLGIPREFAEHELQILPNARPVKQTMRRFAESKHLAIGQEIDRLLAAKFIREIKKSDWVANPVLVPKKNTDILCMCVDFTSLNKCCPKDHSPCRVLTKLSTRRRVASASPFWMPIHATIRFR